MNRKPQLVPSTHLQRIPVSLSIGLSAVVSLASCLLTQPSLAQSAPNSTGTGFQNSEVDNFTGIEQGAFNPLDVIHRANMGPKRSLGQFREDGLQQLDDATADFRRQQLELLRNQRLNQAEPSPVVEEEEI